MSKWFFVYPGDITNWKQRAVLTKKIKCKTEGLENLTMKRPRYLKLLILFHHLEDWRGTLEVRNVSSVYRHRLNKMRKISKMRKMANVAIFLTGTNFNSVSWCHSLLPTKEVKIVFHPLSKLFSRGNDLTVQSELVSFWHSICPESLAKPAYTS